MSDYHPYCNAGTIPENAKQRTEDNIENSYNNKNDCVRFFEIIGQINQVGWEVKSYQDKGRAHDAQEDRNFVVPLSCNNKHNLVGEEEQYDDANAEYKLERHVESPIKCFD